MQFRLPLALGALVVVLAGCPAKVKTVEVAPNKISFKADNEDKVVKATAKSEDGKEIEGKTATFSSSDPAIATVDATGKVKPAGSGKAMIKAKIDDVEGSAAVEVALLKGIKIDPAAVVKIGTPLPALKVAFVNEKGEAIDGADKKVAWSVQDASLATVDATGAVTGVAAGSTTLTAAVGDLKATATLTVNPADAAADEKPAIDPKTGKPMAPKAGEKVDPKAAAKPGAAPAPSMKPAAAPAPAAKPAAPAKK